MTQCCMGQDCPSVLLYMMHSNNDNNNNIQVYRVRLYKCTCVCVINVRTYVIKLQLHNCMGTLHGRTTNKQLQTTVIH